MKFFKIALVLYLMSCWTAHGRTTTWTGKKGADWSDKKSWDDGVPEHAGDTADFSGTPDDYSCIIFSGTYSVGHLQFGMTKSSMTVKTSAGTLNFDNNSSNPTIENLPTNHADNIIDGTISLGGTKTLHIANNSATGGNYFLTFNKALPSGSDLNFVFDGSKTVILKDTSAANYSLEQGALTINGNLSQSTMTSMTIANGRYLYFGSGDFGIDLLSGLGAIDLRNSTSKLTINKGSYSGKIIEAGSLVKSSAGLLTLTGANTYTGGTTVLGGTLAGTTKGLQRGITVASGATVDFDQNTDGTHSGNITGDGSLVKNGTGKVTLAGTNTYGGGTTINMGTLAGTTTSLQQGITVATGAFIDFDQNTDGTYAGSLTGGGSLEKDGTGKVTLSDSGTYNYTRRTIINGGTLAGTTTSLKQDITVASGATVEFDQGSTGTYAGSISGAGNLTKNGNGTLTLSGTNSYSGGTTVTAGMLEGNTGSLQGSITNGASVIFDQGSTGTYTGVMEGAGALFKQGDGTLILTGGNTYSGGTTVTAGTLQGNTGSLQGAIQNNAAVTFNQVESGTYEDIMSGSGSLSKQGDGTLVLTGENAYVGGTTVSGGTLQGNTTSLQGSITNNQNVIFDQQSAGTYPGNMSGTGNLTKNGNGTLTLSGTNS